MTDDAQRPSSAAPSPSASVETVTSAGRPVAWECSLGDFGSHVEAKVREHVASHREPKRGRTP